MPYACCWFFRGCKYENLTTIRTCTPVASIQIAGMIFSSRHGSPLDGYRPWSTFTTALNQTTCCSQPFAGAVGIGDAIGRETDKSHKGCSEDGVIP